MILALLLTWFALGPSDSALAWCNGSGSPATYALTQSGSVVGEEAVQSSGTCDVDSVYKGKVLDAKTDGSCVSAEYLESSTITAGTACTTGSWSNYTYWDQEGASGAYMRLCTSAGCGSWVWSYGY